MKQTIRRERCYTIRLNTGNYKVYPESVCNAVQVETVYFVAHKALKDEIKAIIKSVYKKVQPTAPDCEKLAKYKDEAYKIYESMAADMQQLANEIGARKYTELQY